MRRYSPNFEQYHPLNEKILTRDWANEPKISADAGHVLPAAGLLCCFLWGRGRGHRTAVTVVRRQLQRAVGFRSCRRGRADPDSRALNLQRVFRGLEQWSWALPFEFMRNDSSIPDSERIAVCQHRSLKVCNASGEEGAQVDELSEHQIGVVSHYDGKWVYNQSEQSNMLD